MADKKTVQRKSLQATIGAAAAATVLHFVPTVEGTVLRGYKDPIGIVTACTGNTDSAVLGRPYTPKECEELLDRDLSKHATRVMSCIRVPTTPGERAAFTSFDFNTGRFCGSTMEKLVNAGRHTDACNELPKWIYAGGKVLPGLVKRRKLERDMCLTPLAPLEPT